MKSGLDTADTARLHISDEISRPDKPYVDPITWRNAPTRHYTLESEGSVFTEGDTSTAEITENFFENMEQSYPACFRISKVDRFEVIPHFEVFGK